MKWPLLLVIAACGDDPSIQITSPEDGDTVVINGSDAALKVAGHDVDMAGGMDVFVDGSVIDDFGTTFHTIPGGCSNSCQFDVTFSTAAMSPGEHTIRVVLEYDGYDLARDEVSLNFVAP